MGAASGRGIARRLTPAPRRHTHLRLRQPPDTVTEMVQSRAKSTILTRPHSGKKPTGARAALPYLLILALLCAMSVVAALKDPLRFAEIFGGM